MHRDVDLYHLTIRPLHPILRLRRASPSPASQCALWNGARERLARADEDDHCGSPNVKHAPETQREDVKPVDPAIAQSARVAGAVTIEATIVPDGKVVDAKVVHSVPLLDQTAL